MKNLREQYVDGANAFLTGSDEVEFDIGTFLAENYPRAKNAIPNIAAEMNWDPRATAAFCLQLLEDVNFAGCDEVRTTIKKYL